MLQLPGLIDPHVHLREPGATHKEDFDTGTAAALAGGFTSVLAMPNTNPPLTDAATLDLAVAAGRQKARCDYALFLGAGAQNAASAHALATRVCGLKIYLDQTYGPLQLQNQMDLAAHFSTWPKGRALAAHAEGRAVALVLLMAYLYRRAVHICHISRADEISLIRKAKERGMRVTCEASPHHLFLSAQDVPKLGPGRSAVRPPLASMEDRQALWENLPVIDCFATDHAPHTAEEKDGPSPPPGFPGLETALGLFLNAIAEGRLTLDDVLQRMHRNPRRIFSLPRQRQTWIEIDPQAVWEVRAQEFYSRCGWTPFEGMRLRGKVRRVVLRGQVAFEEGNVISPPGRGRNLMDKPQERRRKH
jgi:carbamoyl-phosphate synthase/aspartate carbamoyltransferase/dihydroorotase